MSADIDQKELALDAIRKKLVGKKLNYKEIYAIMDEIAEERLGDILTTYFAASGFSKGFSDEEIYYLTKAMVETGEQLEFKGIVADKHSIGGVPGTRATLIVVPIIASAGFLIPKSSSRAITTPAGTADAMEVVAQVTFTKDQIDRIVEKTNACIVWGGSFKIAPADDELIRVEEPLLFESYDKILVSVMAKKVAFGSDHIVIDLPYGKHVKLHREEDAEVLSKKFEFLAKKFNVKLVTHIHKVEEPAGQGIGPLLETRDSLKVLEQKEDRPLALENYALEISAQLLDLCREELPAEKEKDLKEKYKTSLEWARDILKSGQALAKFKEIVEAQKGDPDITSDKLHPGRFDYTLKAEKSGKIKEFKIKNLTVLSKILGAPVDKKAGLFLLKKLDDTVEKGAHVCTLYSSSNYRLAEARDSLDLFPLYDVE